MRRLRVITFLLVASFSSAAYAGPKEEAVAVAEAWGKAFTNSDIEGMANLFAPDVLFLGTAGREVLKKREQVREYFIPGLTRDLPRTAKLNSYEALVVSNAVVAVTGFDTLNGVRDGAVTTNNGRVSFLIAKGKDGWKIVQFHRSPLVDPAPATPAPAARAN